MPPRVRGRGSCSASRSRARSRSPPDQATAFVDKARMRAKPRRCSTSCSKEISTKLSPPSGRPCRLCRRRPHRRSLPRRRGGSRPPRRGHPSGVVRARNQRRSSSGGEALPWRRPARKPSTTHGRLRPRSPTTSPNCRRRGRSSRRAAWLRQSATVVRCPHPPQASCPASRRVLCPTSPNRGWLPASASLCRSSRATSPM